MTHEALLSVLSGFLGGWIYLKYFDPTNLYDRAVSHEYYVDWYVVSALLSAMLSSFVLVSSFLTVLIYDPVRAVMFYIPVASFVLMNVLVLL